MSIKRMVAVWECERHKSTALILLLALADYANEDGYCWPSLETLAKRARIARTTLRDYLERLEYAGEIVIRRSNGRGSEYLVITSFTQEEVRAALAKRFRWSPEDFKAYRQEVETRHVAIEKQRRKHRRKKDRTGTDGRTGSEGRPGTEGRPPTGSEGRPGPGRRGVPDPSVTIKNDPSKDSARLPDGSQAGQPVGPVHELGFDPAGCKNIPALLEEVKALLTVEGVDIASTVEAVKEYEQAGKNRSSAYPKLDHLAAEAWYSRAKGRWQYTEFCGLVADAAGVGMADPGIPETVGRIVRQLWGTANPYTPDEVMDFTIERQVLQGNGRPPEWAAFVTLYNLPERLSKYRQWRRNHAGGQKRRRSDTGATNGAEPNGGGKYAAAAAAAQAELAAELGVAL